MSFAQCPLSKKFVRLSNVSAKPHSNSPHRLLPHCIGLAELIEAAEGPPPTRSLLSVLAKLPTLDEEFPEIKESPTKLVNE
jgi:hypothetical protein